MAVKKRFPYKAALVACNGGCRATADCEYGCVACGLCVGVCKFDAIEINDLGVAQVNEGKCIACGACAEECPVSCISEKDGKYVINADECVECGSCANVCPVGAPAEE